MPRKNIIWAIAIILAAVITVWVTRRGERQPRDFTPRRLKGVTEAYRLIEDNYFRKADSPELCRRAIEGMVSSLDEFSTYIQPDKASTFRHHLRGKDSGLGLCVEIVDNKVTVIGPLLNSPAHQAGIFAGDRILSIDGYDVGGMELSEVELLLEGVANSKAEITILGAGGKKRIVSLVRREFAIETVTGLFRRPDGKWAYYMDRKGGIAYVRIREFIDNTGEDFQRICRQLGRPKSLVLDLRDNPGGLLQAAVPVADMFLTSGPIVTVKGIGGTPKEYFAHGRGTGPPIDIVVLINASTASAGEIVAGAWKLYDRAVLVGTRTRGKGCVQTMFNLGGDMGQINLTTSQFMIGASHSIMRCDGGGDWGVDPHVLLALSAPERRELRRLHDSARVMPRAGSKASASSSLARRLVKMDPQLARAIGLLESPDGIKKLLVASARKRDESRTKGARKVIVLPAPDDQP